MSANNYIRIEEKKIEGEEYAVFLVSARDMETERGEGEEIVNSLRKAIVKANEIIVQYRKEGLTVEYGLHVILLKE